MNSDTNKERPTPEIDALVGYDPSWNGMIPADFARRLLTEARESLAETQKAWVIAKDERAKAIRERNEAREQRDMLAAALRKLTEYDLGDIPIGVIRKCNEALAAVKAENKTSAAAGGERNDHE